MGDHAVLPPDRWAWKFRHSLWLVGVIAGVGYFSFLAFGYVAMRTKTRKSVLAALVALGCSVALMYVTPDDPDFGNSDPTHGLLPLASLVLLAVLAVFVNIEYLRWHREEWRLSLPTEPQRSGAASFSGGSQSWSPPSSRYQTPRQAAFAASRLVFRDGLLTWTPCGMRPTAVGGRPFSLRAGPVAGAAHELVWIHGDLAVGYMGRPLRADVLAVCSQDPSSSGARQVLAYLPADLVRPYRGVADHYGDTDAVTEARVREIASTTGLRFTKYQPTFGTNLNRTFPGALSGAWIVPVSMYVFAAVGLLGAAGSIFLALVHDDALGTSSRIALGSFGVAMVVIGILMLPSVARSIRRKQAATAGERSGDEPRPRSVTPPTGPTNLGP